MTAVLTETLAQLVKRVLDTTDSPERGEDFVSLVLKEIPEDSYEEFLRQAIRRLAPVFDNEHRRQSTAAVMRVVQSRPEPEVMSVSSAPRPISTKQHLLRTQYWPQFLKSSIPTANGRKQLGLATAADLLFYETDLRQHAEETRANADRMSRIRSLMASSGASTVGDLDLSVLEEAFAS